MGIKTWVGIHIHGIMLDVITHPYPDLNGDLNRSPLKHMAVILKNTIFKYLIYNIHHCVINLAW